MCFSMTLNRGVLFEHFSNGYLKTSAPTNLKHSLDASKSSCNIVIFNIFNCELKWFDVSWGTLLRNIYSKN